jgi:hypothetical protein
MDDDWSTVLQERVEYYEEQLERFTGERSEKRKDLAILFDIITVCSEILSEISDHVQENLDVFATLKRVRDGYLVVEGNRLIKPNLHLDDSQPMISAKERDGLYMMVRLHKIIVTAASVSVEELGRKEAVLAKKRKDRACGVFKKLTWASEQYLRHALEIAPLQLYYLGEAHPDIAQTFLDIAEGIKCACSLAEEASKYQQQYEQHEEKESPVAEQKGKLDSGMEEASVLQRVHACDPGKYEWALSLKSALQLMEKVRKEGERVAHLYRPHYDLVQARLVTTALDMPEAYSS